MYMSSEEHSNSGVYRLVKFIRLEFNSINEFFLFQRNNVETSKQDYVEFTRQRSYNISEREIQLQCSNSSSRN